MSNDPHHARFLKAGLLAVAAAALFAVMNLSVRALGQLDGPALPVLVILISRYCFGLLTASPVICMQGWSVFRTQAPGAQVARVLSSIGGVGFMFAALTVLPLGLVTALSFSHPFFALIFAVLFLGERVGLWRWSAVAVGFIGVVVMVGLPAGSIEPGVALAVIAAVFFGVEVVMIRKLAITEKFATVLLYNNVGAIAVLAVPVMLVWQTPSPDQWLILACAGVSGVLGQMLFLAAMRIGEASFVAPFNYLTLVYAMIYGLLFFGEVPTETTVAGSAIITAAGLFMLYRERVTRAR